ncbi:MAG: DUF4911 domain-containing protein, partial [Desulfatiglandales bacterium]
MKEKGNIKLTFTVPSNRIMFLSNILMGYDGMALLRTLDAKRGSVEVMVSRGLEDRVMEIIHSLDLKKDRVLGGKKRFYIVTMGCQMNEYDSEYMRRVLLKKGWEEASSLEESDMTIL